MAYYQEIALHHRARIGLYDFWQKLYQQIHFALVENKKQKNVSKIGISFPEYNAEEFLLGTKLRLFADDEQSLLAIQSEKWLNRLSEYVHVKQIAPVPEILGGYACFRQVKMKGSKEKLARRRAKRHGETFEQALAHFDNYKEQHTKLPYINMNSQSNGQHFRLFIEKQIQKQQQKGYFSCYGLSNTSTVPLF